MAAEAVDPHEGGAGDDAAAGGVARCRVLRSFVAEAVSLPTGVELLTALMDLTCRGDLSARERVETTVAWKRMVGFCTAGQYTTVVDLHRELNPEPVPPASGGSEPEPVDPEGGSGRGVRSPIRRTADELAPALGIAPRAASAMVALATRLDADLPAVADALGEGRMDLTQVKIVDQTVRDLPPATRKRVEAAAVAWAPRRTAQLGAPPACGGLRTDLASEAQRLDPEHATKATARGVSERDVHLRPSPLAGCKRLVADLPLLFGTASWNAVNHAAKAARHAGVRPDGTPEDRTHAQLRADILTSLLTGQTTYPTQAEETIPPWAGHQPEAADDGDEAHGANEDNDANRGDCEQGPVEQEPTDEQAGEEAGTPATAGPGAGRPATREQAHAGDAATGRAPADPRPTHPGGTDPTTPTGPVWRGLDLPWLDLPVRIPTLEELARLAEVQVVVAADTLLGEADHPAHVPAFGPVDPDTIRDLATRTRWRRLIVDPDTGTLLHADTTTHRPPSRDPDNGSGPDDDEPPDDDGWSDGGWQDPDNGTGGPGDGGSQSVGTVGSEDGSGCRGTRPYDSGGSGEPRTDFDGSAGAGDGPPSTPTNSGTATSAPRRGHLPCAGDDPRWVRMLTDPVKPATLDHGTTRYRPSPALRLHVQIRDATCIGPACHHPATGCQLDHSINYAETDEHGRLGTTSDHNFGCTCERIHNAKTHGGWHLHQPTSGTFIWTSPTGRTYTRHARPVVPGWHTLRQQTEP